jgi:hypothetical protein
MKKIIIILTVIIAGLVAIQLTGCTSIDKQVFKARQVFDKYPNEAAKYCGDKFPVADSTISTTTDTVKGKLTDYSPVILNLSSGLDSAKNIINQKQTNITDQAGQLAFSNGQLAKATLIIAEISARLNKLQAKYKPCGVDTIKSTYTKLRANTAKIDALTFQLIQASADKEKSQKDLEVKMAQSAYRLLIIIILSGVIGIYCAWKVYRFFTGGAVSGLIGGVFKG